MELRESEGSTELSRNGQMRRVFFLRRVTDGRLRRMKRTNVYADMAG